MGMNSDELYFKPKLRVINEEQIDQIHLATLEVLERTGVKIDQSPWPGTVEKVGPGGHYLQERHTLNHFRETKYSELFDRTVYGKWEGAGAKRFEERLQELTLEKMKHRPDVLSQAVVKDLDEMQASWK